LCGLATQFLSADIKLASAHVPRDPFVGVDADVSEQLSGDKQVIAAARDVEIGLAQDGVADEFKFRVLPARRGVGHGCQPHHGTVGAESRPVEHDLNVPPELNDRGAGFGPGERRPGCDDQFFAGRRTLSRGRAGRRQQRDPSQSHRAPTHAPLLLAPKMTRRTKRRAL